MADEMDCQDNERVSEADSGAIQLLERQKEVEIVELDAKPGYVTLGSQSLPLELFPAAHELPPRPTSANECNFVHYYAVDVGKEFHDQYVFRHANGMAVLVWDHATFWQSYDKDSEDLLRQYHGILQVSTLSGTCHFPGHVVLQPAKMLHFPPQYGRVKDEEDLSSGSSHTSKLCVIGLAPSHAAFNTDENITAVDFNVGKSTSRADVKIAGKRKKNAPLLEGNSVLCKVMTGDKYYSIRCCVRGILLEVNHRLIKDPQLLVSHRDTEGHVAILMPRPDDWTKAQRVLLTPEQYRARRSLP